MNQNAQRGGIAAIAAGGLVVVALIGPTAWDGLWLALAPAAALLILATRELHAAWRPRDGRLGTVGALVLAAGAGALLSLMVIGIGRYGHPGPGAGVASPPIRGGGLRLPCGCGAVRVRPCAGPKRGLGGPRLCSRRACLWAWDWTPPRTCSPLASCSSSLDSGSTSGWGSSPCP